jgi:hypothetical protein
MAEGQTSREDWIIAKLFVLERVTTSLLSLWLTADRSDDEIADRIKAIRTSTNGFEYLPEGVRDQVSVLLGEMLDRTERNIQQSRAAIYRPPQSVQ